MKTSAAINSYTKIGFESEAMGATPHRLISMLLEGALKQIAIAKKGIQQKQIPVKGDAIIRAMAIIDDGLNSSLNMEAGGDLAVKLRLLYEYMIVRLGRANLDNDIAPLDEVTRLLNEIKEGWDGIRPTGG